MTKVSKTLIFTAAFAVIATSAFSEAAWDMKAGMAYIYGGPGRCRRWRWPRPRRITRR